MNSAKSPSRKTSKNTVGVQTVKGMIRLSLPREVSRAAYDVEQKFIFPGLPATPVNLRAMEAKALTMTNDIGTGNFDPTWEKYQLGVVAANKLVALDGGKKPEMGLLELWEKFKEYKRPSLAETTFKRNWEVTYVNAITAAWENTDKSATDIRNYLINNYCSQIARNTLSVLEQTYKWGIQHEFVSRNPFLGMASEINIKKATPEIKESFNEFENTKAFSLEEMYAIIEYFENTTTVSHWANYVKFLFWTGCRPGEAAALRWKHISANCDKIKFSQSYDSRIRVTKTTKTETIRIFPCQKKLQNLLMSLKPPNIDGETLIFTSKNGHQVDCHRFFTVWKGGVDRYKGAMNVLLEQGKIRQYLKPYATRHTFISHQVNAGVPAHVIAAWCGNSADVIWKHYYQHQYDTKPADI